MSTEKWITQEFVNKIVERAKKSNFALEEPTKLSGYSMRTYGEGPYNLEELALKLVDVNSAKYSIVSIVFAALEEVYFKGIEDGRNSIA